MLSANEASVSTHQLSRQCTCVIETESDSDNDSDAGDEAAHEMETTNGSPPLFQSSTKWVKSLSLEIDKPVPDFLKTSHALHNAEDLRQASALDNVFCSCYNVDIVLSTIQRRERGQFSPLQKLLLEPESIKCVFLYATSAKLIDPLFDENGLKRETKDPNASHAEKYRTAFVATGIILKFYLKVMAWYGNPKQETVEKKDEVTAAQQMDNKEDRTMKTLKQSTSRGNNRPSRAPSSRQIEFRSNASMKNMARIQRLRASMRFESSGSSLSDFSLSDEENEGPLEDPSTRGYLLRLDDLTATEWKRIFGGLFRFLGPNGRTEEEENGQEGVVEDDEEVDGVLVSNMCKIMKNYVIFPAVHKLMCDEHEAGETERLLPRLIRHVYNPNIASLVHGLLHLSVRRGLEYFSIIRCLVEQIVDSIPTRFNRSLSSVSLSSTVSSTSSMSPRSSISGSSLSAPKPTPLSPSLFTTTLTPLVHARISGCAELLSKILNDEFPNTFRYYAQTRIQLASFEDVEPFERELFPPRMTPSDPAIHDKLKKAVLAALVHDSTLLARVAEFGVAELRFLDAHGMDQVWIPSVLVIDVLRHAMEFSLPQSDQLEPFLAPIHLVLDSLCALVNYHQHLSTISELAARDCFSDSDSDEDEVEEGKPLASSKRESPRKVMKRHNVPSRRALYGGLSLFALSTSPRTEKTVVNHRPLASALLVMHVVELLNVIILLSNDRIDRQLTRFDLARSMMDIFEKFPDASILHCRVVKLYLNLLNRPSTNDRVNNPLLRSVFRSPDSILEFILHKLNPSSSSHTYDAHLAILGVKIAKICSSPTLHQELIRQFCNHLKDWNDFAASLIATHYQQMDALNDSLLGFHVATTGAQKGRRNTSDDATDANFVLARPSSCASAYLSRELEPFRRLPVEKEGFGSSQNLARGTEAVHPSDMFQSRSQSKSPESITDILESEDASAFDVKEKGPFMSGFAYQKCSKWAKVFLTFNESSCELTVEDAAAVSARRSSRGASSTSFLQHLLKVHKQPRTCRAQTFVVCNAREWIAFGRSVKKRDRGAFGFQVDVFDGHREQDETLTFVTRSSASRMKWFESMERAVTRTRTARQSFSDIDEAANVTLVDCVAKDRHGTYLVVPDVHLLGPVTSTRFFVKSEVPEEMPFWGTYHGVAGLVKYGTLLTQCLDVVAVEEKSIQGIGYSVIVEFDATFRPSERRASALNERVRATVTCACTDTYLISGNQIIGLTRTIADSEKLLHLLCDEVA
ncbi:hypothetical protein PsorP6_000463 [Peronosclerospora sorghi]|uniref:Uncharacterized protein n=1 Tax=Peronosclerospora sorghi TaxID=230839 RepID=A0ACC0WUU0_9STRA|nr:hypothetical protein PsorP6_000463 [Peronosclerospora sorghi]